MSRKRDTNWSRDEITVLLDSIMEITRARSDDNKRTNSREVFEYAAKKLGEKGHTSRAEREKCRTKWKKMKEEFTHAKRAREGDSRYKEAPGIQPFYDRMQEFINGIFDNISPHSTIVRRTSSLSSRPSSGMRTSARIAATTVAASQLQQQQPTLQPQPQPQQQQQQQQQAISILPDKSFGTHNNEISSSERTERLDRECNGELCTIYTTYNNAPNNNTTGPTSEPLHQHADISYRVSTGYRQITIFGDQNVDIKFRGDCVTINKIDVDYQTTET